MKTTDKHPQTTTFTIDADYSVQAFDHKPAHIGEGCHAIFSSEKELREQVAKHMPTLVSTWNAIAGTPGFDKLKEVKKFPNTTTGCKRLWEALQVLVPQHVDLPSEQPAPTEAPAKPKAAAKKKSTPIKAEAPKAPAKPKAAAKKKSTPIKAEAPKAPEVKPAEAAAEPSKKDQVLGLIARKVGATAKEIQELTGWQPHTVRGFMAGTVSKKLGLKLESAKNAAGDRVYRTL